MNSTHLKYWLVQKLRRISYQWPERKAAIRKARVSRGKYLCAHCNGLFGPKEINADHKDPVIDPEVGFVDWNTYIARLFCSEDNIQIICKIDHHAKSAEENERRSKAGTYRTKKRGKALKKQSKQKRTKRAR